MEAAVTNIMWFRSFFHRTSEIAASIFEASMNGITFISSFATDPGKMVGSRRRRSKGQSLDPVLY